jgi:hypothetical protein
MIEKERVEFGLFSTQISREWHIGHAVRAFSRPSSDPRLLQLFMSPLAFSVKTPLFKGFYSSAKKGLFRRLGFLFTLWFGVGCIVSLPVEP